MTRYPIRADVAMQLAGSRAQFREAHQLVAPTLLHSELLTLCYRVTLCYRAVRQGEISKKEADARLDHVQSLRVRLLGDQVLQRNAWAMAARLGWSDTFKAEYVALARLQADSLVTLDPALAAAVAGLVTVTPIEDLV